MLIADVPGKRINLRKPQNNAEEGTEMNKNASLEVSAKALAVAGHVFSNMLAGMFFVLLFACVAVMAVFSIASPSAGVCLIGGLSPYSLIPEIPYWCGAVFAFALVSLSALAAVGCVYSVFFVHALVCAYGRICRNQLACVLGKAALPPLTSYLKLKPKTSRNLKRISLISAALFATCFVSGYFVCSISAGALGFWHAWNWFN